MIATISASAMDETKPNVPAGNAEYTSADSEGLATLRGLPAGTWTLEILDAEREIQVPMDEVVELRRAPRDVTPPTG